MSDGWHCFWERFPCCRPPCVMYTRVAKNKGTAIKQIASFYNTECYSVIFLLNFSLCLVYWLLIKSFLLLVQKL